MYERYQGEGRGAYAARLHHMPGLSLRDKYKLMESAGLGQIPGVTMRSYDDYRKAHERTQRKRKWTTRKRLVLALLAALVPSCGAAESITDIDVEQDLWNHEFNKCLYEMSLKMI